MLKNVIRALPVLSVFISSAAFGGHEQGNGGNAVVCRDTSGRVLSAELLDFYEARVLRQMQLDLEPNGPDYKQRVAAKINALKPLASTRANLYESWFGTFDKETLILHGVNFEPIEDSEHLFVPKDCAVEQLAINRNPELPSDHRYLINGDLWDYLDNASKAGLVLHELIYREMASLGETNSVSSRYLNGLIHSKQFVTFDQTSFVLALHDIGIPTGEWRGWVFDLKSQRPTLTGPYYAATLAGVQYFTADGTQGSMAVEGPISFWPSGKVIGVTLAKTSGGWPYSCANLFVPEWNRMVYAAGGTAVGFDQKGRVAYLSYFMKPEYRQTFSGQGYSVTPVNSTEGDESPIPMSFFEDGSVRSCLRCAGYLTLDGQRIEFDSDPRAYVDSSPLHQWHYTSFFYAYPDYPRRLTILLLAHDQEFRLQGQAVTFRQHTSMQFWPSGSVLQGTLAKPATLKRKSGETVIVSAGMHISLDERGNLTLVTPAQE